MEGTIYPLELRNNIMNGALFVDRDGTLIKNVPYLGDPKLVEPRPDALQWVKAAREANLAVIVVSNQSGVARGVIKPSDMAAVNRRVNEIFDIDAFYCCMHGPEEGCRCRKPKPGLIEDALANHRLHRGHSIMVGDSPCDLEAGWAAKLAGCFLVTEHILIMKWLIRR
jgi:histidinol-phosphate phosphatase family protein